MELIPGKHIMERQGKIFLLYAGALALAHEQGLTSIETQLLQIPAESNKNVAICSAVVTLEKDGIVRKFCGIGDADPNNVAPAMATCTIRMSETRSKNRALKDAINTDLAMEGDVDDAGDHTQRGENTQRGNRDSSKDDAQKAVKQFSERAKAFGFKGDNAKLITALLGAQPNEWNAKTWQDAFAKTEAQWEDALCALDPTRVRTTPTPVPEQTPASTTPPLPYRSASLAKQEFGERATGEFGFMGTAKEFGQIAVALLGGVPERWDTTVFDAATGKSVQEWEDAIATVRPKLDTDAVDSVSDPAPSVPDVDANARPAPKTPNPEREAARKNFMAYAKLYGVDWKTLSVAEREAWMANLFGRAIPADWGAPDTWPALRWITAVSDLKALYEAAPVGIALHDMNAIAEIWLRTYPATVPAPKKVIDIKTAQWTAMTDILKTESGAGDEGAEGADTESGAGDGGR